MTEGRISPQNFGMPAPPGGEKNPNQNLLAQTKPLPWFREPKLYKPLILEAATFASAYWAGAQYAALRGGAGNIEMTFLAFGAFACLWTLETLFIKSFSRSLIDTALEAVGLLIPLYTETVSLLVAAGAVYVCFALFGRVAARAELQNSVEMRFFRTARLGLTKFTSGIILFVLLLYIPQWRNEGVFIPKAVFQSSYNWASGAVKVLYPAVDINSTFIALTRGLARLETRDNAEFRDLTPRQQEEIIAKISENIASAIRTQAGITAAPEELTSEVVHRSIVLYLLRAKEYLGDSFMALWGIAAFFFWRAIGIALYWIVLVVSFILYELILASGFVRAVGVEKTQEVFEF